MKINLLLFFFLIVSYVAQAQEQYSYISDRRFFTPEMLYGYPFKPSVKETIDGNKTRLKAGSYSFMYSGNYLYVKGKTVEGVYSVNNIVPVEYGYNMKLMNARDPSIQGHLKVILNDYAQVEALVLKRSSKEQEIIFHLPVLRSTQKKKDETYFTDLGELELEEVDSLWGTKLYPFIMAKEDYQLRLTPKDSVMVTFQEDYKIIDKRKKPKAAKKAKKKKRKKREESEENELDESLESDEQKTVEVDTLIDLSKLTKQELEEVAANDKQVRLLKKFFIIVKTFELQKDGTRKPKEKRYMVKEIKERVDDSARKGEEKYQIDFSVDGKKHIYLFLLHDRTISSLELGYDKFYMRGH